MSAHFTAKTEMARTYGVNPKTIYEWMGKPTFPKKGQHGWHKEKVNEWVNQHRIEVEEAAAGAGDKAEETQLKCERLRVVIERERENLEQAKIETKRQQGKLHSVSECDADRHRAASTLRARVDSWQQHQIAKHPSQREFIDGLCVSFLATLEGVE